MASASLLGKTEWYSLTTWHFGWMVWATMLFSWLEILFLSDLLIWGVTNLVLGRCNRGSWQSRWCSWWRPWWWRATWGTWCGLSADLSHRYSRGQIVWQGKDGVVKQEFIRVAGFGWHWNHVVLLGLMHKLLTLINDLQQSISCENSAAWIRYVSGSDIGHISQHIQTKAE